MRGRCWKFGDNISTDHIIAGRFLSTSEPGALAAHCMEDARPEFHKEVSPGDIVVAGNNFGCGSAREQAASCLLGAGIKAVVARSFSRVFFRNCINTGLLVVECPAAADVATDGGDLWIDYKGGMVQAEGQSFGFTPYPESLRQILESGGLIPYITRRVLPAQEKSR